MCERQEEGRLPQHDKHTYVPGHNRQAWRIKMEQSLQGAFGQRFLRLTSLAQTPAPLADKWPQAYRVQASRNCSHETSVV